MDDMRAITAYECERCEGVFRELRTIDLAGQAMHVCCDCVQAVVHFAKLAPGAITDTQRDPSLRPLRIIDQFVNWVRDNPGEVVSISRWSAARGLNPTSVGAIVHRAASAGTLVKLGRGRWALPDAEASQ